MFRNTANRPRLSLLTMKGHSQLILLAESFASRDIKTIVVVCCCSLAGP
jgi:hypothetical protein